MFESLDIQPIEILVGMFAFLFSATCHEAAHAWVAKLGGDETAYQGGQVSLDPTPHISRAPTGMLLVPMVSMIFFGFPMGWALAPYDPFWASRHPRRYGLMSLAGPLANLVLAVLTLTLFLALDSAGVFETRSEGSLSGVLFTFFYLMFLLNVILFLFNMIPLPPLDGVGVLNLFLPERKIPTVRASLEGIGSLGLPMAWLVFSGILNKTGLIAVLLIPFRS